MQTQKKVALVTGGSRGLGKNMALSLSKKGIDVIITYNTNKDEAQKVVDEIKKQGSRSASLRLNTGSIRSFESFSLQLSDILRRDWTRESLDFFINNAGIDSR